MAPFVPEELDVFTIPHSRMKELVSGYVEKLEKTNFSDYVDMQRLLSSLSEAFQEFKKHEQIENNLIMKKLKNKLKQLSIRNTAVCNCHKDSHLTEILHLVQDGYTKKTVQDRVNYGLALRKKLEDFTEDFLPHMQQEEEVFQPLLLQYFTYKELCEIRKTVIQLHLQKKEDKAKDPWQFLKHLRGKKEENYDEDEKDDYCEYLSKKDDVTCEWEKDKTVEKEGNIEEEPDEGENLKVSFTEAIPPDKTILDLPGEIMLKVMTYLGPCDLGKCQQVCCDWSIVAKDPSLWREFHPVKWAKGEWDYQIESPIEDCDDEDEEESAGNDEEQYILIDEDADVDESSNSDEENTTLREIKHEAKMMTGLVKHVLPSVGPGVRVLNLAHSRALTSGLLHRMLKYCPNVEYLDLTQTRISDAGLKGLGKNYCGSQLKKLMLNGCVNVTDTTLVRLALALSQPSICCHPKETKKKAKPPDQVDNQTELHDEMITEKATSEPQMITEKVASELQMITEKATIEPQMITEKAASESQMPIYHDLDIENLTQKYLPAEKPLVRDKWQADRDKHLNLVHMVEDYSVSVEYQDQLRVYGPTDCWTQKEHYLWEKYVGYGHLEMNQNRHKGRMKETGDPERCTGGSGGLCITVAGGLCCQQQMDGIKLYARDEPYLHDDEGSGCHPPPQPVHGDGPPNVVIVRDKPEGQVAIAVRFKKDCCEVSVMGCGHEGCKSPANDGTQLAIEDCAAVAVPAHSSEKDPEDEYADYKLDVGPPVPSRRQLQYLSLSGCYQISDFGLSALADCGAFGELYGLDLSGCSSLTGPGIEALVKVCPALDPEHLYYCDNIIDGPLVESASGCRNQQCGARYCCRMQVAQ